MKPTKVYIERRFQEFNKQCFGGQLPMVPVRISIARTYLGRLTFKRKQNKSCDFVLHISNCLDLPEQEVEDTLLHEMIHLYIEVKQLKDMSSHGPVFRRLMADINRRYNRHLSISHKRTAEEQELDTQRRLHLLCISTLDSGEQGITIAAKSRVFQLWDELPALPCVVKTCWYATYDPFFNRYPRALTPKIYRSPEGLAAHLEDARPIRREGSTLYFEKAKGDTLS